MSTSGSYKRIPRSKAYSRHAGAFQELAASGQPYKVTYTSQIGTHAWFFRAWTKVLAYGALLITLLYAAILLRPAHWYVTQQPSASTHLADWIMLASFVSLQVFLIVGTYSATRSTVKAKNPVPVRPAANLRIAMVTTRAPGEPYNMVATTLKAIKEVHYRTGSVDAWLLDETNDPRLHALCSDIGVNYFSRNGIDEWNTKKPAKRPIGKRFLDALWLPDEEPAKPQSADPFFAARSKHGNFNAWFAHLDKIGMEYDILAGVDTDHVPEPNYLQRILGYFRDPDIAYAVGPQVYGNYKAGYTNLVVRWAESQASFFQSTIQRAGNASNSPMFVGTNYAIRIRALRQIGGFQPCITEDMATGLAIHTTKNPQTGNNWKSVYTPDVLAIGEGPNSWSPYFTQQWRWAAGTFDTWFRVVWKVFYKLPPRALLHYFLILTYYPFVALTWLLAVTSSLTYLFAGGTAIVAPWGQFIALYLMSLVMQLSLYFWNRQYNVSPHEAAGSYGVSGMLISTLVGPVYLSALLGVIIGKKAHFIVTKKGTNENSDGFGTFRHHIFWALLLLIGLVYGIANGRHSPALLLWTVLLVIICIVPIILGTRIALPARQAAAKPLFAERTIHA